MRNKARAANAWFDEFTEKVMTFPEYEMFTKQLGEKKKKKNNKQLGYVKHKINLANWSIVISWPSDKIELCCFFSETFWTNKHVLHSLEQLTSIFFRSLEDPEKHSFLKYDISWPQWTKPMKRRSVSPNWRQEGRNHWGHEWVCCPEAEVDLCTVHQCLDMLIEERSLHLTHMEVQHDALLVWFF